MNTRAWTEIALPKTLSQKVGSAEGYKESIGHLAVRPYNEHNPELSTWWHFPAAKAGKSVWPAYHLGKFLFDKPGDRTAMRAGLHVEKGLGSAQAKAFGSAKASAFELKASWVWHRFVKDLGNGSVIEATNDLGSRTGLPVELEVSVGAPLDEPELFESYSEYRFHVGMRGLLSVVGTREAKQKLTALKTCATVTGLGQVLEEATASAPWSWVNVVIGTRVPIGKGEGKCWGGAEFWELACEPLIRWVR